MKLLTAVIAPHHLQRATAALDSAGFTATTVTSAYASGLKGRPGLRYRGVEYRDQRCVRLEILVQDFDLEYAVAVLRASGDETPASSILWASDVDDLGTLQAIVPNADVVSQT